MSALPSLTDQLAEALQRGIHRCADLMEGLEPDLQEAAQADLQSMRDALSDFRQAKPADSTDPNTPGAVGIRMEGGLIQSVWADRPINVTVIDYDTEGASEDNLFDMPQDNGSTAECYVSEYPAAVMPDECERIKRALASRETAGQSLADEPTPDHVAAGVEALRADWQDNFTDDALSDAAEAAQAKCGALNSVTAIAALENAIREAADARDHGLIGGMCP